MVVSDSAGVDEVDALRPDRVDDGPRIGLVLVDARQYFGSPSQTAAKEVIPMC